MAVEKVWKCDLCGEFVAVGALRRVGVRLVEDRSDAADWVDVGPECHERPLSDVLVLAAEQRQLAENDELSALAARQQRPVDGFGSG